MRKTWYSYCTDGGQFFSGIDTIDNLRALASKRHLNISLWTKEPGIEDATPAGLITEEGNYYDENEIDAL